MRTEIRDIANFIVIERKLEKDAEEDRRFEAEDKSKAKMDERLKHFYQKRNKQLNHHQKKRKVVV